MARKQTNDLGHFKITKEKSSPAGVRRIKAVVVINGKYYPAEQFTRCCGALESCACDSYHLHSARRGLVFPLDGRQYN